jgi:hypothetical protein
MLFNHIYFLITTQNFAVNVNMLYFFILLVVHYLTEFLATSSLVYQDRVKINFELKTVFEMSSR